MVDKVGDQSLERDGITENGKDVAENDALVNVEHGQDGRNGTEDMPAWGNRCI